MNDQVVFYGFFFRDLSREQILWKSIMDYSLKDTLDVYAKVLCSFISQWTGYTCCAHSSVVVSLCYACDFWHFLACRGELYRRARLISLMNLITRFHFTFQSTLLWLACDFTLTCAKKRECTQFYRYFENIWNIFKSYEHGTFLKIIKSTYSLKQDRSYVSLLALLAQVNHYERIKFWGWL